MDSPCLLLKLLLFGTILTTAASLQCETCTGSGRNCSGTMETCKKGEETCVITYTVDINGGVSHHETTKGCGNAYRCTFPPVYFHMDEKRTYRSHGVCCKGEECNNAMVSLPPVDTKQNGKRCPGCHAWSDSCKTKMVNCTGKDFQCFEMASHFELANGSHIDRTMMGCTNKYVCAVMEAERSQFWFGTENIQKARCETVASQGYQPTSLLLPPFFALLLMKILM
ncbi:phospholipase A2 inhibitor gamma subunit B [Anolis carolinensis]|uniref:UPAR/Ly6 domain-containing protein n=1 Tax=Anolis carolinensis TaxID=28377 RepID=R4G936_ANOCA|nr:PREDICTED: phospholipase A2 inhibitor subunit gamma B isoform X1 [Anolis carolinensis]XP_003222864.1 PREDICTED: phospholipase A2 inhibitor subunit gamma B isoform X1 [Anolis carolinensis]|eukprot:XP_003222863.1 PREDICTED: phospholipase A2 inhibitor subunit gamma B isoform X1 [Anolis carolinensis]